MKRFAAITMALFTICGMAAAQVPTFELLTTNVKLTDMTDDGRTLLGIDQASGNWNTVMWTPENTLVDLGGFTSSGGPRINADGSAIAGNAVDVDGYWNAGIWLGGTSWQTLGSIGAGMPCDYMLSSTYGISDDGSTIVGLAWDGCSIARAFSYTAETGMVDLGSTVVDRNSRANGISEDGSVIYGWQEMSYGFRQGCYWDADGTQHVLWDATSGFEVGEAYDSTPDGSVLVGGPAAGPLFNEAWIWTAETGAVNIGILDHGFDPQSRAYAVTDDGSVVTGNSGPSSSIKQAFIWTEETGMMPLVDYLTGMGMTGHENYWMEIAYISGDGRTIIGHCYDLIDFTLWAYRVTLPATATFDVNIDCSDPGGEPARQRFFPRRADQHQRFDDPDPGSHGCHHLQREHLYRRADRHHRAER